MHPRPSTEHQAVGTKAARHTHRLTELPLGPQRELPNVLAGLLMETGPSEGRASFPRHCSWASFPP